MNNHQRTYNEIKYYILHESRYMTYISGCSMSLLFETQIPLQ